MALAQDDLAFDQGVLARLGHLGKTATFLGKMTWVFLQDQGILTEREYFIDNSVDTRYKRQNNSYIVEIDSKIRSLIIIQFGVYYRREL